MNKFQAVMLLPTIAILSSGISAYAQGLDLPDIGCLMPQSQSAPSDPVCKGGWCNFYVNGKVFRIREDKAPAFKAKLQKSMTQQCKTQ